MSLPHRWSVPSTIASVVLVSLALLVSGSGGAAPFHVSSSSGGDTNDGSRATPFLTLQHYVDLWDGLMQHDCLAEGTHDEELAIRAGGPGTSERNRLSAWDTDGDGELGDETFVLDGEGTRNVASRC